MKTINHAWISNYNNAKSKKKLSAEDFRKVYEIILEDYKLTNYADGRRADVVCIRQAIMKIARNRTNMTLKQIGEIWGKDHSTIIHGLRRVNNAYDTNDELYLDWESEIYNYF